MWKKTLSFHLFCMFGLQLKPVWLDSSIQNEVGWNDVDWGGLASPNPSLPRASLQLKIRCRFALILFLCVRSPAQTSLAGFLHTKIRWSCLTILFSVVEEGGFEPPVRLHVRQFSKLLVSATHPSFQTLADLRKQSVCFPKRVQR